VNAESKLTHIAKKNYLSPLRYPGGKRKLASKIGAMMDCSGISTFDRLIEPFAGGAAVSIAFLEANLVDEIILADIDPLLSAFWQTVFSCDVYELADKIVDADVSIQTWNRIKNSTPKSTIDMAFSCVFLNRTSFSGSLHEAVGPIGGKEQKSEYKISCRYNSEALALRLIELSKHSNRVKVLHASYREVARRYRSSNKVRINKISTFWYFDPPFFHKADKLYRFYFDQKEHLYLKDLLGKLDDYWFLSYDQCSEARDLYRKHPGYAVTDMRYTARKAQAVQETSTTEVIVCNFNEKIGVTSNKPEFSEKSA